MFLVLSTVKQHRKAFNELVKFRDLAYGSRVELMRSLAQESLHLREAVLPLGFASLVIKNLLGDVTLGSSDIVSTYPDFLDKLVTFLAYLRSNRKMSLYQTRTAKCTRESSLDFGKRPDAL